MWSFLPFRASRQSRERSLRREERFQTNLLSTNLGSVVDISASGIRVHCPARPGVAVGNVVPLTIRSPQCKVIVQSRVVRVERTRTPGARGTDVSFAFLDAKPALRAAIAHLGRFGFIPRLDATAATDATPGDATRAARWRKSLPDYYGVLGVGPDAGEDDIRRAYHQLARKHHPDHSRNAESVGVFESVVEAYKTLKDAEKRRAYDAARRSASLDAA